MVSRYGRVPVVGGDDFAHERVADHVFGLQVGEGDVVDAEFTEVNKDKK